MGAWLDPPFIMLAHGLCLWPSHGPCKAMSGQPDGLLNLPSPSDASTSQGYAVATAVPPLLPEEATMPTLPQERIRGTGERRNECWSLLDYLEDGREGDATTRRMKEKAM